MYFRERVRLALEKRLGPRDDLEEIVKEVEAAVGVEPRGDPRPDHLPPRIKLSDID